MNYELRRAQRRVNVEDGVTPDKNCVVPLAPASDASVESLPGASELKNPSCNQTPEEFLENDSVIQKQVLEKNHELQMRMAAEAKRLEEIQLKPPRLGAMEYDHLKHELVKVSGFASGFDCELFLARLDEEFETNSKVVSLGTPIELLRHLKKLAESMKELKAAGLGIRDFFADNAKPRLVIRKKRRELVNGHGGRIVRLPYKD